MMRSWRGEAVFLQERIEILFRRLLTMEAHDVAHRFRQRRQIASGVEVVLRL